MMTGQVKVLGGVNEPEVDSADSTSELDADIEAFCPEPMIQVPIINHK